jgi:SMI1 / KNR4 family (SUKH-1)
MLNTHTLQSIQAGTDEEVYSTTTMAALWMAAGGYLAEGDKVLAALWAYGLPHSRDVWLPDTAFMVLWHAAGRHPDFVPFPLQGIDVIEKNMRGRLAMDRWSYKMPDKPWTELTGQDLLRKAYLAARLLKENPAENRDMHSILTPAPGSEPRNLEEQLALVGQFVKSTSVEATDVFPSSETEAEALAMLTKMMEEGYYSEDGLALGAELAARNGQLNVAIRFAKSYAGKSLSGHLPVDLCSLAASRHVAPLLLQKILSPELELSDQVVRDYVAELLKVLDMRIKQGRSLVYGHLSWKELLQKLSEAAIEIDDQSINDQNVRQSGWLGYQGATKEEIRQAEERLGATLPNNYKEFLTVTNGFGRVSVISGVLLPVAEIDYLKNVHDRFSFDLLLGYPQEDGEDEAYREKLNNAILISQYHDEQEIWLIPEDPAKTRWQTWFFAAWMPGETRYPGFRHYMEDQLQGSEGYLSRHKNGRDKSEKNE